ncbi:hypothetical protein [Sphingomonas sp. Leaf21]|uniref:hypothetical protein n=1 Tax=Sphingomonas sp. Leaf21 TaxID=2876550 RepID=UPI001E5E30F6|nr:hypothetical protein [Sphingomonas sp. Leaf21]
MVSDRAFSARNIAVLREAQGALNVAFGAILSAYVGVSLSNIDNHPFDHHTLARFFLGVAGFILCLCVGNSVILRGEFRLGIAFLMLGAGAAYVGLMEARHLGFETAILRILSTCWIVALLGSNAVLTAINYLHHRDRT